MYVYLNTLLVYTIHRNKICNNNMYTKNVSDRQRVVVCIGRSVGIISINRNALYRHYRPARAEPK